MGSSRGSQSRELAQRAQHTFQTKWALQLSLRALPSQVVLVNHEILPATLAQGLSAWLEQLGWVQRLLWSSIDCCCRVLQKALDTKMYTVVKNFRLPELTSAFSRETTCRSVKMFRHLASTGACDPCPLYFTERNKNIVGKCFVLGVLHYAISFSGARNRTSNLVVISIAVWKKKLSAASTGSITDVIDESRVLLDLFVLLSRFDALLSRSFVIPPLPCKTRIATIKFLFFKL